MTGKKKERICEVRGQELEDYKRYHNWIHQGRMRKNAVVFVPLSDDDENPSLHNARRMIEEQDYFNPKEDID